MQHPINVLDPNGKRQQQQQQPYSCDEVRNMQPDNHQYIHSCYSRTLNYSNLQIESSIVVATRNVGTLAGRLYYRTGH